MVIWARFVWKRNDAKYVAKLQNQFLDHFWNEQGLSSCECQWVCIKVCSLCVWNMAIIVINLNHSGGNLSLPICKAKNQKRVLERCRDFHELHQRAKFISSSSLLGTLFQLMQKHFKRNKKALAISHFRISSLCSFWRFVSKLFHVYRTVELHL